MTVTYARAHLSSIKTLLKLIKEKLDILDTCTEPQDREWSKFFQTITIATPGALASVMHAAHVDNRRIKFLGNLADQIAAYNTLMYRKRDERGYDWNVLRAEITGELNWLAQSASEASGLIKQMRQPGWFGGLKG